MANVKPIKVELQHQIKQLHISNSNTKAQYMRSVNQFSYFLENQGMKKATLEEAKEQIQNFIDFLQEKGLSGATQKARLAGICAACGEKMEDYKYDSPGISTRGRADIGRRNERNERVIEFAQMVGIREAEYANLRGSDLLYKDGRTYVVVRKGKGGKRQEQLILERDAERVASYFKNKAPDERIFNREEMAACEHANLHRIRREHAQELYQYYANMPTKEREEITELLRSRFEDNPKKRGKFDETQLNKPIILRGIYRDEYKNHDKSFVLDRFAVRAVSVLHLAHYRDDVVCHHYLI